MVTELINKYVWLINTITKAGQTGISLEDIQDKWESRWGIPYARRSFFNHKDAVREVFGVNIECNRGTRRYFIRYSDDVEDLEEGTAWLVNTFTVNSLLELGKERLSGRVSVANIPSGQKYLTDIIAAMLDNYQLRIYYQKYKSSDPEELVVNPYALKESEKRWYLVAYSVGRNGLRVYSLDRIKNMEVSGDKFRLPEGFDVDYLFMNSYGIYLPDKNQPVNVVLECTLEQAHYLDDLPLHKSQKIKWMEDKAQVVFRAVPNPRMIMDLCALGPRIKVISPEEILNAVLDQHRQALGQYE